MILTDNKTKIDEALLPGLDRMIREEYEYLKLTNATQHKRAFINDGSLFFTYPQMDHFDHRIHNDELSKTQLLVEEVDMPEAAKELYRAKCQEQVLTHDLLQAVKEQKDEAFHAASIAIYGKPDEVLYWHTLVQINKRFRSLISKIDPKRRTLHKAYQVWSTFFLAQNKPEKAGVFNSPSYAGIYIPYYDEVDSAEKIASMFEKYLEKLKITEWKVLIENAGYRSVFSVDQATRVVHVPHDTDLLSRKSELTKCYLKALLAHEIGVHVVRRERGEQSSLGLLAAGLDNYLRGEEGVATFAEQLITGTNTYSGETGYFSVGTAMGLLSAPLDFAGLFDVLHAYFTLNIADEALEKNGFYELDELRMQAYDNAWSRSLRTFRGSTGQTPGAVYTRDIIYLEGNRSIWKLANEDPAVKDEWLIGKYNPANQTHVKHLTTLGILN